MNITERSSRIVFADLLTGPARLRAGSIANFLFPVSIAAVFFFIATVIVRMVPINVDESVQYHVIACDFYKNAKYHTFWNPCDGSTDLNLLGLQLKRAYWYIGSVSSYIYYPLFKLAPHILTQRLLGVFFLVIFVGSLALLEKFNKRSVIVLFGLSFPLTYQFINDTGPVRFGLLMVVLTPLFTNLILHSTCKYVKIILNIFLGILLYFAVEDKPFFLYSVPSVILLTIAYNSEQKPGQRVQDSLRVLLMEMWLSAVIFFGLTTLYLVLAEANSGQPYIFALMASVTQQGFTDSFVLLLSFLLNFHKFTSMVYESQSFRFLNIFLSLFVWSFGLHFLVKICKEKQWFLPPFRILFTLLAFLTSVFVLLVARNAWTGHHFIYPYTFALLAVCQAVSYQAFGKGKFLLIYSFVSVVLAGELFFAVPAAPSAWERYKIFEYLKGEAVGKHYLIAHLSLGTYYVSSLYGHKDQLSLQIRRLDGKTAKAILHLSDMLKRKIICVCRVPSCNSVSLFNGFLQKVEFDEISLGTDVWKLYVEKRRL